MSSAAERPCVSVRFSPAGRIDNFLLPRLRYELPNGKGIVRGGCADEGGCGSCGNPTGPAGGSGGCGSR